MEANEMDLIETTGGEIPPEKPAEELETPGTPEEAVGEPEGQQATSEEDVTGEEPKSKKDRVQERIDEITLKRREAEREAAYWRGRAEATVSKGTPTPTQPVFDPHAPFSGTRPVESDFETFGEYEAAKDEWLVARAKHEARQEAVREVMQTRASADMSTWMQHAPANLTDFETVVRRPVEEGGPPLSVEMVEICHTSPVGHQLLYQLAENPKEVARLRAMPAHLMAMEIARREAKLSVSPASPKKISDAPNPIQPLTPATTSVNKSLEELSDGDYIARRNREEFGPNWKG